MWEARSWNELSHRNLEIIEEDSQLRLIYTGFSRRNVNVEMVISLRDGELYFDVVNAENLDREVLVGIMTPKIGGFSDSVDGALYVPDRAGQRLEAPFSKLGGELFGFNYPMVLSAQYLTYNSGTEGWALYVEDQEMKYKNIEIGKSTVQVTQYPFLESGMRGTLPSIVLKTYDGSWHVAADRYREWFDTWSATPRSSSLVDCWPRVDGFAVNWRPSEYDVYRTFVESKSNVQRSKDLGYEAVWIVGWMGDGHDTDYPEHRVFKIAGGQEGLKSLVEYAKSLDLQVGYYMNGRWVNVNSEIYHANRNWAVKPYKVGGNTAHHGGYTTVTPTEQVVEAAGDTFHVLCPHTAGFVDLLTDRIMKLITDYEADFIQLDMLGAAMSFLCFDEEHGHSTPATAWSEGVPRMLQSIFAVAHQYHPHLWLWVEGAWEGTGQYVQAQQGGFWPLVHSSSQQFTELYRYTFPNHILFADPILGGLATWCTCGAASLQADIRGYREFHSRSRFMDTVGLEYNSDNIISKWHKGNDDLIIIASNITNHPVEEEVVLRLGDFKEKMELLRVRCLMEEKSVI